MKVYKFGGASVKDADGVRNMLSIIKNTSGQLIVVVSAMGKMTNLLETVLDDYLNNRQTLENKLNEVKNYHLSIIKELFEKEQDAQGFWKQFHFLEDKLKKTPSMHYDFEYDRIVSMGELMSSAIVADFFNKEQLNCKWTDIRTLLKTDEQYREANVDWDLTTKLMNKTFSFKDTEIYLTQGFLGGTLSNLTTTLGREGSDYTAAIIGYATDAEDVTIWKDVPGVLNADPKWYPNAKKIDDLSYQEAVELTYYGANVIHPKTLKPLKSKNIPLYVKSFLNPEEAGTVISSAKNKNFLLPVFIMKPNQIFITFSPKDFSFIIEDKLVGLIEILKRLRFKINLMENSALNFSVCLDKSRNIEKLFKLFSIDFFIKYNEDVQLVTIRQYNPEAVAEMTEGKTILYSQFTRKTAMFVLK